jgi:hypothetical protein
MKELHQKKAGFCHSKVSGLSAASGDINQQYYDQKLKTVLRSKA